jgi:hypothetical protein
MSHKDRRKRGRSGKLAAVLATSAGALMLAAGSAGAVFPDFTGCPRSIPNINGCIDVQTKSGTQVIKSTTIPTGASIRIRGAVSTPDGPGGSTLFTPIPGTNGFFGSPIEVPGGLTGIGFPIPLDRVYAIPELAGPSSSIRFDLNTASVAFPLKLRLVNPILNSNCHIGTNSSPINVNLITGTTNPRLPNRPISGRTGTVEFLPGYVKFTDNVNVDNTFSVPGASGCGLFPPPFFGLIDIAVNVKMGLPSAAGNNSLVTTNDIAIGGL